MPIKLLLLASAALAGPAYAAPPAASPASDATPAASSGPHWEPAFSTSLDEIYSDNVYGTSNYRQSDRITAFAVDAELARVENRGSLRVYGSERISRYRDHQTENTSDYTLGADARHQLGDHASVSAGIEYSNSHEERTSPDNEQGVTPTPFDRLRAHAGGELTGAFGTIRAAGDVVDLNYGNVEAANGAVIDSAGRDRREMELGVRFEAPGAERRPFLQTLVDSRDYRTPSTGEPDRSSRGYAVLAGLRADQPDLEWEVMAGLQGRDFASPLFRDLRTFDFGGLMVVRKAGLVGDFRADRSIDETTLIGASAAIRTGASIDLSVNPAPGWSAGVGYSAQVYEYQGINRTDHVIETSLWGRRAILPHLALEARYRFSQRNSNAAGGDYDENRVSVGLVASLEREEPGRWSEAAPAWRPWSGLHLVALAGGQSLVTALDGPRGQGFNTSQFGDAGTATAIAAGYDVRIGQMLLGLEAEAGRGDASWKHSAERVFGVEAQTSRALDLRAGLILRDGNTVFARGGVVQTRFHSTYALRDSFTDEERRLNGMRFGVGAETPFGPMGGFVRVEYLHVAYPDYDIQANPKATDNFANSEQQFRIGFGIRPFADPQPPATAYEFSGLYLGGFVGQSVLVSSNQGFRPEAGASGSGFLLDAARSGDGPEVGLLAGYGRAWRRLYAGAEVETSFATTNWNIERDPTSRIYSVQKAAAVTEAIRAGVLLQPDALLYVRSGIVQTRFDNDYADAAVVVRPQKWTRGVLRGVGMEIATSSRWRARFDYSNIKFPPYSVPYSDLLDRFKNNEHRFSLGMIFRL